MSIERISLTIEERHTVLLFFIWIAAVLISLVASNKANSSQELYLSFRIILLIPSAYLIVIFKDKSLR